MHLQLLIFERYATKDDYLKTHRGSKDFQAFRPKFAELGGEISGMSYIQQDVGYMAHWVGPQVTLLDTNASHNSFNLRLLES